MWGVFDLPECVHVAPSQPDGRVEPPHILDEFCDCDPEIRIEEDSDKWLVIHNQMN